MPHSTRTFRILSASCIALLMIGGAYAISGPNPLFGLGRIAEAQSAEELLKEYAAKDTDTDGLPDWQEALYGTDPANPESFQAGIKDGEAVAQGLIEPKVAVRPADEATDVDTIPGTNAAPASLTDRFAQTLLKQYLQNRGENPPTQEEIVSFVKAGVADLAASTASTEAYNLSDIRDSGDSGREALLQYAVRVERALAAHNKRPEKNELFYFSDAIKGDMGALEDIRALSNAYEATAKELIKVSVPAEMRRAHLAFANALMNMATVTEDMASLEKDPLRALMGIGLYDRTAEKSVAALTSAHAIFNAAQVNIPEGTEGWEFLYVTGSAAQTNAE